MLETRKYVLIVEGETEMWYFLWLRDQINRAEDRKFNVSIVAKVEQSPRSFYKGTNSKITPEVIHICDVESNHPSHTDKFQKILKEMSEAKKQKNIKYYLGYSNFTFELWIILHKKDCYRSFTDRKQYLSPIQQCFHEKFEDLDHYKREQAFKRCLSKMTLEDVRSAIRRADHLSLLNAQQKKLMTYCGYSYYYENPALSINEIVKRIFMECGMIEKKRC